MRRVFFIVGPTGIGKTKLSLELAERLEAEIVSADSRQVYRYMDIGTAKPSKEELSRIPHHFIDIKNPDEDYSAGEYGLEARQTINAIFARHKQPITVGGSGLYIRALVDGFFGPRISDPEVKKQLNRRLQQEGLPCLYAELAQVDPATARRLHPTDTQRILRALEVHKITGRPFSEYLQNEPIPADFEPRFVGLTMDRQRLYARLEQRVDQMLAAGLVEEVRSLLEMGYGLHLTALQSVGYREVIQFLQNELPYDQMVQLIKQKTRNYAKRQFTWFRKDPRVVWINVENFSNTPALIQRILEIFQAQQPS